MALIIAFFLALFAFWLVWQYNRLVSLRNQTRNALAQIDVQLRRRYDLVPNLVETAKAYLQHESATLLALTQARSNAMQAADLAKRAPQSVQAIAALGQSENALGAALGGFYAVAENYPELKADATMSQLSEELASCENRIGFARQAYNDQVMAYNTATEQFPTNLISSLFSFKAAELLAATENAAQREAPKVKF